MADPKTSGPDPMQLLRRADEAIKAAGDAVDAVARHLPADVLARLRGRFDAVAGEWKDVCSGAISDPSGEQGEEIGDPLDRDVAGEIAHVVEYGDSREAQAARVLRKFMCCPAGRNLVEYGLLRPFRLTAVPASPATDPSKEEQRCERPPVGWQCTRDPGHDGPCAAVPSIVDRLLRASSKEVGGDGADR